MNPADGTEQLKFRDPVRARGLRETLDRLVSQADHAPVSIMHVCGSHEQAIARFGLRGGGIGCSRSISSNSAVTWLLSVFSSTITPQKSTKN